MENQNFMKRKDSLEVKRILVGVAGGSASGKTTLCNNIKKEFQYDKEFDVLLISMDNYYKTVDRSLIDPKDYNFDHPDALDFDLMYENLQDLLNGNNTNIPTYSFVTHERLKEQLTLVPSDVIMIEGIFGLYDERIRNLMQYKIFMHCDDDIRLCRRLKRDLNERGRKVQDVLFQYNRFVKRSFDEYIKPTMNYADLIVPGSINNSVSVSFIVQYLKQKSQSIGFYKQMIKKELVYFYDVIQPFENLIGGDQLTPNENKLEFKMTEEQESKKIFFFYPNSDDIKREVRNGFNSFSEKFTIKKLLKTLKEYCKISFQLLKKVCELENIDLSQIQPQDLKEFVTKVDDVQFDDSQNNILLICIPFYQQSFEDLLHKTLQKLQKLRPNQKIAILTLFSGVSQITKLKDNENNVNLKCVINCLCIGNKQKFTDTMIENCVDQNAIEFLDPYFKSDKFHQRLVKSCNKLKHDLSKQ